LSYLRRLPFDTLKIDRSFVNELSAGSDGLDIVKAIVEMAHSLRLEVIAEGVETEEQLRQLRELDCRYVQGFLFSRPVDAEVVRASLQGNARIWPRLVGACTERTALAALSA
jgi:EAL domain-containing protein (putative c-di-GMP-specific phosphodiesterase class I)